MTGWLSVVLAFLFALPLLALIVRLALPLAERHERQAAMRRHPSGKHRAGAS